MMAAYDARAETAVKNIPFDMRSWSLPHVTKFRLNDLQKTLLNISDNRFDADV